MRKGLWIIGAAALLLTGCGQQKEEDMQIVVENSDGVINYEYILADKGDVQLTKKISCTYRQQDDEEVSFSLTGRLVDKVYVAEGDAVKKGDLLAELSAGNLERQIEDLEYRIARNELLLEYIDNNENLDLSQTWVNYLYNSYYNDETRDELVESIQQNYRYQREDCEDSLELDRQSLAELQQELRYCRVYAKSDGVVYKLKEDLEDSTSKAGDVIMRIVDTGKCTFEAQAPEFADAFREGEPVDMTVSVGNFAGQYVLMPYNMAEWDQTQQFAIYDGPTTSGIEVGTNGTIRFVLDAREQVLCLPTTVMHVADDKYYVYVVDENEMRQIRWVEVGLYGDDTVEILSGLEAGERVIRR